MSARSASALLCGEAIRERWVALHDVLLRYEMLWKPTPFLHHQLPWATEYPALEAFILQLSEAEVQRLDMDPDALAEALSGCLPDAREIHALAQVDTFSPQPLSDEYDPLFLSIPAAKADQVRAFAGTIAGQHLPFLEWCSGKGHLARVLSALYQQPALCLEKQPQLCDDGSELAAHLPWPVTYEVCDVLTDPVERYLEAQQHAVALHACGHLHRRLLVAGVNQQVHSLSVAPCCYHTGEQAEYQAFSHAGQRGQLTCSRDNLRLATREFVTGRPRRAALREQNNGWRMGFDLLQRDVRGVDEYLPARSVPRRMLQGSFADYCRHIAHSKGLALPEALDFDRYEAEGARRYQRAFALELVRSLFRRPLELWLVLDRAMFLQEHGYHVTVGQFCERQVTPRNLLIQAQL